jgi:hypothetical protein
VVGVLGARRPGGQIGSFAIRAPISVRRAGKPRVNSTMRSRIEISLHPYSEKCRRLDFERRLRSPSLASVCAGTIRRRSTTILEQDIFRNRSQSMGPDCIGIFLPQSRWYEVLESRCVSLSAFTDELRDLCARLRRAEQRQADIAGRSSASATCFYQRSRWKLPRLAARTIRGARQVSGSSPRDRSDPQSYIASQPVAKPHTSRSSMLLLEQRASRSDRRNLRSRHRAVFVPL